MTRRILARFRAAGLVFVVGCSAPSVAPVSGVVTVDGKPVPDLTVQFIPLGNGKDPNPGGGSYGRTGADGRFEVQQLDPPRPGAVVGRHTVVINSREPASGGKAIPIPLRYNDKSELTFDVPPGGTADARFDLSSAGGGVVRKEDQSQ